MVRIWEKIGRFSDFFRNVGKCLVFIWDISRKMWKWRSWGNRKADTSGLISSFSPCRLDQRKEKYSFARHFSNCQKCFLSLSKILLGRAILRVIKCYSKRRNIATSLVVPKNISHILGNFFRIFPLTLADFPAVFFHISHWYLSWNTAGGGDCV